MLHGSVEEEVVQRLFERALEIVRTLAAGGCFPYPPCPSPSPRSARAARLRVAAPPCHRRIRDRRTRARISATVLTRSPRSRSPRPPRAHASSAAFRTTETVAPRDPNPLAPGPRANSETHRSRREISLSTLSSRSSAVERPSSRDALCGPSASLRALFRGRAPSRAPIPPTTPSSTADGRHDREFIALAHDGRVLARAIDVGLIEREQGGAHHDSSCGNFSRRRARRRRWRRRRRRRPGRGRGRWRTRRRARARERT